MSNANKAGIKSVDTRTEKNSRGEPALKPFTSPQQAKGVQFESMTIEKEERDHKRDDSASTEPLVTDS